MDLVKTIVAVLMVIIFILVFLMAVIMIGLVPLALAILIFFPESSIRGGVATIAEVMRNICLVLAPLTVIIGIIGWALAPERPLELERKNHD